MATSEFILGLVEDILNDYHKQRRNREEELYGILKNLLYDKNAVGRKKSIKFNEETDNVAWVDVPRNEVFDDSGDVTCCYIQEIWVDADSDEIYVIFNAYYLGEVSGEERLSDKYSAEVLEVILPLCK